MGHWALNTFHRNTCGLSTHFSETSRASQPIPVAALLFILGIGNLHSKAPQLDVARIKSQDLLRTRSRSMALMSASDAESWDDVERLRNVLRLQRLTYGEEDTGTLSAMSEYADALLKTGRWVEAELVYKELLDLSRKVLGSNHPGALKALKNYADMLTQVLCWDEALPFQKEHFHLSASILGAEHEDTLAAMGKYAVTLQNLDRVSEAQSLTNYLYELASNSLGTYHPQTLSALNSLADILIQGGLFSPIRLAEAGRMKKEVLEIKREVLGKEHPDTLKALRDYESIMTLIADLEAEEEECLPDVVEGAVDAEDPRKARSSITALVTLLKSPFEKAKNLIGNARVRGQRNITTC